MGKVINANFYSSEIFRPRYWERLITSLIGLLTNANPMILAMSKGVSRIFSPNCFLRSLSMRLNIKAGDFFHGSTCGSSNSSIKNNIFLI